MEMITRTEYDAGGKLLLHFRRCPACGKPHELKVDQVAFENWSDGVKSLEEAFPDLTPAERELFITAMCGECWDEMPTEEDEAVAEACPHEKPEGWHCEDKSCPNYSGRFHKRKGNKE